MSGDKPVLAPGADLRSVRSSGIYIGFELTRAEGGAWILSSASENSDDKVRHYIGCDAHDMATQIHMWAGRVSAMFLGTQVGDETESGQVANCTTAAPPTAHIAAALGIPTDQLDADLSGARYSAGSDREAGYRGAGSA